MAQPQVAQAHDSNAPSVDPLALEPSKELALHVAMLPALVGVNAGAFRGEVGRDEDLAVVAHGLRDYGTPVAAFRALVARFDLSDGDRRLVASTLIEPFVAQPALAVQILARFVEAGLIPYGGDSHAGPYWNATVRAAGIGSYETYAPEGWPCIVACHLNLGLGNLRGANVESLATMLGDLAKLRGWFDNHRDADHFFDGFMPTLRMAGFTPWECVRLSVAAMSGAQLAHSGLQTFRVDRSGRPYTHGLKPGQTRWAASLMAPLPALVVGKVSVGLRSVLESEPYASEAMLVHPVLQQAGTTNVNSLVALLGRQVSKDFVAARRDFAHRLELALRGAGAFCGLTATTWDPALGFRESAATPGDPLLQAQVDGQWVFQYLLGDRDKGIRKHAFEVLARLCYGEGEGTDGLALLRGGGIGRFPFGLERALLEAMAQEPALAKAV